MSAERQHASGSADSVTLVEGLRADSADYVKVAIVDIDGVLRGKYLDKSKLLDSLENGFGFCDVVFGWDAVDECYDNGAYTGWRSGYPDGVVKVDLNTHRRIPWEGGRHFFLCDYAGSNEDIDVCPRRLVRRLTDQLAEQGMEARFGLEFEWFNFRETPQSLEQKDFRGLEPITPGMFGYSVLRQTHSADYFEALLSDLRAFGVPLEGLHTETGPGVYEAAIAYSDPMEAADRGELFKAGTKEIAHRFGILPSFMARWDTSLPGCSGHAHQSVWSADGQNLFADPAAEHGLSSLARSWIAGLLELLPDLLVLFAPTVNSYKRLVDGFWAPTRPTWGVDNRTVACRAIASSASATRVEMRVPGSDVNPYLAVAGCLAAGMWGIENNLELDQPATRGSAYADESVPRLERNLLDATRRFGESKLAREVLGDGFVDHFAATREWEWRQHQDAVTDWELRRYFEII